eukprot:2980145-Pyramimonas_sp.AAC.1
MRPSCRARAERANHGGEREEGGAEGGGGGRGGGEKKKEEAEEEQEDGGGTRGPREVSHDIPTNIQEASNPNSGKVAGSAEGR